MSPAKADPRVEAWLGEQPRTLRPVARAAAGVLDEGLPGASQDIKWGFPTWVGNGNIAAVMAFGEHVNLQFYLGTQLPDPQGLLEGTGKDLRHVKLQHAKDAETPGVKGLVRAAWRLDQAQPGKGKGVR